MIDFINNFFSYKKNKLDLKEFARVRENIKKEYIDKDIKNYALKLLKDNFYRYESVRNDEIIESFQKCNEYYKVQFYIELKDLCNHFLCLNNKEALRSLIESNFDKEAEELLINCFDKKILDNIAYKAEYDSDIEYSYKSLSEKKRRMQNYIGRSWQSGSTDKTLYIHLKLYFRY